MTRHQTRGLFLFHEVPVVDPPAANGVRGPLPLPFHLVGCQLHELVGDIAEVRHRRVDGDGSFVDQVDGIRAGVVQRPWGRIARTRYLPTCSRRSSCSRSAPPPAAPRKSGSSVSSSLSFCHKTHERPKYCIKNPYATRPAAGGSPSNHPCHRRKCSGGRPLYDLARPKLRRNCCGRHTPGNWTI